MSNVTPLKRTPKQNDCIHDYCGDLAEALNDAGYDIKAVFEVKRVSVPWTKETIKLLLWKEIQKKMFHINSTTKLNTKQVNEVYQVVDRHIAENFGIHVPFPSRENKG